MSRRVSLPVTTSPESERRPSVDAVRKRLGGRASSDAGAGEVVVLSRAGIESLGVVLFVAGDALDVWLGDGVVRRTPRAAVTSARGVVSRALAAVAADARVFGALSEGQRVRYDPGSGDLADAKLVEKCRYGAVLLRDDGALVGVGFRRVWPIATGDGSDQN